MNTKYLKIAKILHNKGYIEQSKTLVKLCSTDHLDLKIQYKKAYQQYISSRNKMWKLRDKLIK